MQPHSEFSPFHSDAHPPGEAGRPEREGNAQDGVKEEAEEELEEEEEGGAVGARGGTGQKASLHHTTSPVRVHRSKGPGACSHSSASDYELSLDLKNKQTPVPLAQSGTAKNRAGRCIQPWFWRACWVGLTWFN
ncbi:hypothetical protein AAFF_G00076480 [Aldrovandia affinis]|uniref:Uncharacterized protein n=1 Tax=Aldrovandia affinis TaxID=143900 RepID=A0AAD7RXU2_9TELE|nr:hypothetical protein AAFF_G00076480 [Aldrovandia affinis]